MDRIPFRPPLHSRRGVLRLGQGVLAVGAPALLSFIGSAAAATGEQNQWRFCTKCHALFFYGYDKGRCPAGDHHVWQGYDFYMHHDDNKRRALTQYDWRFCNKCHTMFFDGYRDNKGACPAGGPHVAQGFMFGLYFTNENQRRAPAGRYQGDWRFCGKCNAVFFNGYPDKGRCPKDGQGHAAIGWTFHLAFKEIPQAPPSPPPPPQANTLGEAIASYASSQLGKCVDGRHQVRSAACPTLPVGQIGDGECTHLVEAALAAAGAKPGNFSVSPYDWGADVTSGNWQRGDILQLEATRFTSPDGNSWWGTSGHHSAIIVAVRGKVVTLVEQNVNNIRRVAQKDYDLSWPHTGRFVVYRAEKR
jgi:hypothetical protein